MLIVGGMSDRGGPHAVIYKYGEPFFDPRTIIYCKSLCSNVYQKSNQLHSQRGKIKWDILYLIVQEIKMSIHY